MVWNAWHRVYGVRYVVYRFGARSPFWVNCKQGCIRALLGGSGQRSTLNYNNRVHVTNNVISGLWQLGSILSENHKNSKDNEQQEEQREESYALYSLQPKSRVTAVSQQSYAAQRFATEGPKRAVGGWRALCCAKAPLSNCFCAAFNAVPRRSCGSLRLPLGDLSVKG